MAILNKITQPPKYSGGNSDDEKLNAFISLMYKGAANGVTIIDELFRNIGLPYNEQDEIKFEALLKLNPFVEHSFQKGTLCLFKISASGIRYYSQGKNYLDYLNEQKVAKKESDFINRLQFEKIQAEVELLQNQLFDYDLTKTRSRHSITISWISAIIGLLSLIIAAIAMTKK